MRFIRLGLAAALALLLAVPAGSVWAASLTPGPVAMYRASSLIGDPVTSNQGALLGHVQDVIVTESGNVAYLIVSMPSPSGVGEKMIPVPYNTSFVTATPRGVVLTNIDKTELDNAPSISNNQWQALEDPSFDNRVNSYYGNAGRSAAMSTSGEAAGMRARAPKMIDMSQASSLIGAPVKNVRGQMLGEVDDLVIGPSDRVDYLVVSQVPGASGKLIPVPFDRAYVNTQRDSIILRGIDKADLDSAPSFSADNWREMDSRRFDHQVRGYYGEIGYGPSGYGSGQYAPGTYREGVIGRHPRPVEPTPETRIGPHGYIYGTPRNPWGLPPEGYVGPAPGSSGSTQPFSVAPQNY